MILVKQLTPTTWMLNDTKTEKTIGMVNFRDEKYYLLGSKEPFSSLDAIANHFGTTIKEPDDETDDSEVVTEINGYPIKHKTVCEIETKYIGGIAIETYKTKLESKKVYAAGWYGLKFKSNLGCGIGVLFQTLVDTGFIGPFKTEIDLQFAAKQYNNEGE
jgi:hypothetical protein